ncbi:MAG: hypothetical protein AB7I50_00400 [Vicinamibacterales bacterium]
MTRRLLTPLAFALLIGWCSLAAAAQAPKDTKDAIQKLSGTVTMAAPDHVMFKMPDGKDGIVMVMDDTKVSRDKKPMKPQDIKVGVRVDITAERRGNNLLAKDILVGADPKPSGK